MTRYLAAIDQGTTSSRCLVFDSDGRIIAADQAEHEQFFPQPGWVEHDPAEIWHRVQRVTRSALDQAGLSRADLAAVGITNQRETTLLWDAQTGEPVGNAIVWQDMRTDQLIRRLAREHPEQWWRERCGLPLATYFAGPKLRWRFEQDPVLHRRAEAGELRFGTIDAWLIWQLTGEHVTDVSNASRTMLMNLATLDWDDELLTAMGVPRGLLPRIVPSSQVYGEATGVLAGVPVAGALGDQQAALFGQTCFNPGEGKCTYGTGSFLLMNTGTAPVTSRHGLLTTVGYQIGSEPPVYALEGSIAITGALIQWLRDKLGIIEHAAQINELAESVTDNGGCYIVPAFSGLFAPHWRPDARGVIAGLTSYVSKGHLARAALESTAWQVADIVAAMNQESDLDLTMLKVDGGMTASELLLQIQADLIDAPVVRPTVTETTGLGAAYAAGLAVGFWPDLATLREKWQPDRRWEPTMSATEREAARAQWRKAVTRSLDWA
ncbi:glycerol kinase GlpK [Natronosporangium hydrolyticum]|uniref:Glycerol kinase n=1 Tax=Natronosporangium hydrolyticum TaxID=2811111 RepID=A0A895YK54_9ACTN|nr:glycerol kinase GlpK [Natronosporangium hydrolyticum]QSB15713.1 glycerol kinase GlpK [Natronosporangium hydrolyticum]